MAALGAPKIVVWERLNKMGKWCPYVAEVCQFLEKHYEKESSGTVNLEDVDENLKIYKVHFKDMVQISDVTGTKSQIRRHLYDNLSAVGRGFSWQWQDDHDCWNTYEIEVNDFIDCAFLEGKKSISLGRKFHGYHYEINFTKMLQINKRNKKKRKIRRFENVSPYPVATISDDCMEVDQNDVNPTAPEIPEVLSPQFLNLEIPGTKDLEYQVNAYKRNVEGYSDTYAENGEYHSGSKFVKYSPSENGCDNKPKPDQSSASFPTTVALVNGKQWTEHRPPHTPHSKLKPVPGIDPLPTEDKPKKKRSRQKDPSKLNFEESNIESCLEDTRSVLEKYTEETNLPPDFNNETCIICCESLSAASSYDGSYVLTKLTLCSHIFHKACIEAMYNSGNKEFLQCPSCKRIHGEKRGMQPPGEMIYHVLPYSLPGYPENETIRIIYDIHSGTQGPDHPYPGRRYTARGFPRHCYLPDNEMGRKILRLLIKAWKRRLIFTIGRSSTTGEENTVTWNEIHHKTEFGCNRYGHGYPDPNYFGNVLAELEAHGIIDDEVRVWVPAS